MHIKVPDLDGYTVEVYEWINDFISHFIIDAITYLRRQS